LKKGNSEPFLEREGERLLV